MTLWDTMWKIWSNDGWLLIFTIITIIFLNKGLDHLKIILLIKNAPDDDARRELRKTFDEVILANDMAKNEIDKLNARLLDTKELIHVIAYDIQKIQDRIKKGVHLLEKKKSLVAIKKGDIQEVIDVLEGKEEKRCGP